MMKKRSRSGRERAQDVVFSAALTPLEAAVLPAKEQRCCGALRMVREAFDPWRNQPMMQPGASSQRAKI